MDYEAKARQRRVRLKRLWWAFYIFVLIITIVLSILAHVLEAGALGGGESTPPPACPPEDSLGEGTPWPGPNDLSYDYLAACSHCLHGTPTPTSLLATYQPTATVGDARWHLDCPSSYQFTVDAAGGGEWFEAKLSDKASHPAIYGTIFRFQTDYNLLPIQWATDCSGMPDDHVPMWLCDSPDYDRVFVPGQQYCAVVRGYEFLCDQFALGSQLVVPDSGPDVWLPYSEPGKPLALPFRVPGTDTGDLWLLDARLIVHDADVPSCAQATPTPTMTPTKTITPTPSDTPVQGPLVRFTGAYDLVEGASTGTFGLTVLDGGLAVRALWQAPAGVFKSQSSRWYLTTANGPVTSIVIDVTGPAIPFREWYDTCAAVGDWPPYVSGAGSADSVQPIPGGYRYTYSLNGDVTTMGGYGHTYRACPTDHDTPITYDWTVRIVQVNGQDIQPIPTPTITPTPTPQPEFYLGAERQNLTLYGDPATCWVYDSLEWVIQNAGIDPVIGTCYDAVLLGETGIQFGESDMSHDGYGAPWSSFWPDGPEVDAGVYRTCVTDGYTIPGGSFADPATVCAQACPDADRLIGLGDWPKGIDGDYAATWKVGCQKNGSLGISDMGLIYYGDPPLPMPTATPTPPWLSPTPNATFDPNQCSVFDWRDDFPAGDVDIDFENLIIEGECYTVIPQVDVDIPGLPLGIGGGAHIEWEGFEICVNWVRFPSVEVLGLAVSLDWFLLPALAWLVNRILTL